MPLVPLIIGLTLLGLGTCVTCINFYTSFIRYTLHRLRGGTRDEFRWVSGFPLVGSMLLWFAALALIRQPVIMWTALGISLFDTGGPLWFAGTMVYMTLFGRRTNGENPASQQAGK